MFPPSLTVAPGFLLLAVLLGCGSGDSRASEEGGPQDGRLVIIGGGLQAENMDVYQAILDGREGEGPLCVFPTASADPEGSMGSAIAAFDRVGGEGTAQGINLTVDNPQDAGLSEVVGQIESCSGFYFVGGQQGRIVQVFRPEGGDTPAYQALLARHGAGAVVSGSSAGAAIMTDPMIGGGSSVGALRAGAVGREAEEGVVLEKGLGLWKGAFVDQHFLARGRWARLLVAVLATDPFEYGMGIDENTALVVEGDSAWVVGASGVLFFDARDVVRDPTGKAGSGIVLHLLGSGDGVDLPTGRVQVQASKAPLGETADPDSLSEVDLFARWGLLTFLHASALSGERLFTFQQDGHALRFEKGTGFSAGAWEGMGVQDLPRGLSVGPYLLSVLADLPG